MVSAVGSSLALSVFLSGGLLGTQIWAQSKEMPAAYGYYTPPAPPPTSNGGKTTQATGATSPWSYTSTRQGQSGGPYAYPSTLSKQPDAPKPATAAPSSEIETLRQQKQALEQRLAALEKGQPNAPVTKKATAPSNPSIPVTEYRVRRGDTLWGLAIKNRTSVAMLRELNHLPKDKVVEGQVLRIPAREKAKPMEVAVSPATYGYPVSSQPKSRPSVQKTPTESKPSVAGGRHVVGRNESLGVIAKRYNVSLREMQAANGLANANLIHAGQVLVVPGRSQEEITAQAPQPAPASSNTVSQTQGKARFISTPKPKQEQGVVYYSGAVGTRSLTSHRIRRSDTLESIAKERGISTDEITRYNGLKNGQLPPAGEELVLPLNNTVSM